MLSNWKRILRLYIARALIKIGKLKHADFTEEELNELLDTQFPQRFEIDVPISQGELVLTQSNISIDRHCNHLDLSLFGSVIIGQKAQAIYRAHVEIKLEVFPEYDATHNIIKIERLLVRSVSLIEDEYAFLESSKDLLKGLMPKSLQQLISGTLTSALDVMAGGGSNVASHYIQLYMNGSKQRVLAYHIPQIEALVSSFANSNDAHYHLDINEFDEHLFSLYGKKVLVEDGVLRFKF